MDTLSILYHFAAHFGDQMKEVLELQGFDSQFGQSFGVSKSVQLEVSRKQIGFEVLLERI